jgi:serine protease 7 (enterokinase)
MCCENVYNLNIHISSAETTDKIVFQRKGNYGRNWNYGQVTLNETGEFKVGKDT